MKEFFGASNISNNNGDVVQLGESRSMNFPVDLFERVERKNREAVENRALVVAGDSDSIRAYMAKRLSETL